MENYRHFFILKRLFINKFSQIPSVDFKSTSSLFGDFFFPIRRTKNFI